MKIETKYDMGQIVYLITDPAQTERMITAISFSGNGSIKYCLTESTNETWHYEIEFSPELDTVKKLLNNTSD